MNAKLAPTFRLIVCLAAALLLTVGCQTSGSTSTSTALQSGGGGNDGTGGDTDVPVNVLVPFSPVITHESPETYVITLLDRTTMVAQPYSLVATVYGASGDPWAHNPTGDYSVDAGMQSDPVRLRIKDSVRDNCIIVISVISKNAGTPLPPTRYCSIEVNP